MGVRSFALRRIANRYRIDDEILRHLTTFQRFGEMVEVEVPRELLPVGVRTALRAVRTRAAPQIGPDWVWPYWIERQIDPSSPAFVPRGHLPFLANVTGRNWTALGNPSSPLRAVVDPRGLVTPWADGWSLDWWVGAEDRWYVPSRETAVRQGLVDHAPVVETKMRVPGGDIVHRVWASVIDGAEYLTVEVANQTAVPVALALAVRPYNPEGLAVVEEISQHGATVSVDGRPALVLPTVPRHAAGSRFKDGDSAAVVMRGDAPAALTGDVDCEAGLAQAAFVLPLTHRTSLRALIPMQPAPRRSHLRRRVARLPLVGRRSSTPALPTPRDAPGPDEVAHGWSAQVERGMRVSLPAGRLADAVEANRRHLLGFHDGADVTPGPLTYHRFWFRDAAYILGALDRWGFHDASAEVLATYPSRQRSDGFFFSQRQEWDSNGAALHALAEHWRLTGDRDVLVGMDDVIARGVAWIDRARRARGRSSRLRRGGDDAATSGLLPAGISAEHLGPVDRYYWDDFWGLAGMLDGAGLLEALDQDEAARQIRVDADAFRADIDASLALVAERLGTRAMPAGPSRGIDSGAIGSLVAAAPLGLLGADDPRVVATAEVIRERFCVDDAFFQAISHTGLGTYLTMQLASVELAVGDPRALGRLAWLVEAATDTFCWPEAIHPRLGSGCMGDGHHGWAAADFMTFVRSLLVREVPDGVDLVSLLPPEWLGHDLEVHDAPTHHGRLSFGVRWHGERPALLWEITPHASGPTVGFSDGRVAPRLRAPGIDPTWSADAWAGEALLAPPAPPEVSVALG